MAGLGGGLNARRHIRRIAEHFAVGIDDDRSDVDADAGGKRRQAASFVARVEFGEREMDGEAGAGGAFGVVLLRARIAEQRHHAVAENF